MDSPRSGSGQPTPYPGGPQAPIRGYAELHSRSNFTFLGGGTPPERLAETAASLGLRALAITDKDGLYGVVRFHEAAAQMGLHAIVGADLTLEDRSAVTLLARDREGYANLSTLISKARTDFPRGDPRTPVDTLRAHAAGLILLAGPASPVQHALRAGDEAAAATWFHQAREAFGADHVLLEGNLQLRAGQEECFGQVHAFARRHRFPGVAANDVRYATAADRILYDVLSCVRERTTLADAALLLEPNAERRLKSAAEMHALFRAAPDWIARTVDVAAQCTFGMTDLHYRLPGFPTAGETPDEALRRLAWAGAARRYGEPFSDRVRAQMEHELGLIGRLDLAGYFLIVWDIVRFCGERGILCQGRGSAANSVVCYCLGITAVDPIGLDLLFERFLSEGRSEAPDIDLDIAHNYREQVIQYVYERYGRDHAAMVCEVITYRGRSAIRDVGKALGFSLEQVDRIAKRIETVKKLLAGAAVPPAEQADLGVEWNGEAMRRLLLLTDRIQGFPRHISIHVGGMVVSAEPLRRIVPVEAAAMEGRSIIQWDKDDAEALKLVKIDLLGLGMLSLLQDGLQLIERHHGARIGLHELDYADARVYASLTAADTVGVFQVESRAQMNTLPRLKPKCFYDLVVEVALIRPGPIQGEMVHPYLRRRDGLEPVTYPHPDVVPILARTLGVPLFQEQGMRLAITAAGFTPGEADALRKAMGHKRSHERMQGLLDKLVNGMRGNGYDEDVIRRIVQQLTAFADYGFPESHAASFALLVFASGWMKVYYPAVFYTALLNAQPMGFYSPSTIVNDARRHGVEVRPVDMLRSGYDCAIEDGALRLGFRYVRGIGEAQREAVERMLAARPFRHADTALQATLALPIHLRRNLVQAGAFDSLGLDRRTARWRLEGIQREPAGPLLDSHLYRVEENRSYRADGEGQRPARRRDAHERPLAVGLRPAAPGQLGANGLGRLQETELRQSGGGPGTGDDRGSIRHSSLPFRVPPRGTTGGPGGWTPAPMTAVEELQADYHLTGLSVRHEPMAAYRDYLRRRGCRRAEELRHVPDGTLLEVAGVVICRQRPGTAKGMLFLTLEDETGMINLVVFPDRLDRFRSILLHRPLILARGRLERAHDVTNILVDHVEALPRMQVGEQMSFQSRDFR